jgi:hypothetical protein
MLIPGRLLFLIPAVACMLCSAPAQSQQNTSNQGTNKSGKSHSAAKPDGSKDSAGTKEENQFKQEFGPTQASKRGEKPKSNSSGGQGGGSHGTTGSTDANHASNGSQSTRENMRGNHKDVMTQAPPNNKTSNARNSK